MPSPPVGLPQGDPDRMMRKRLAWNNRKRKSAPQMPTAVRVRSRNLGVWVNGPFNYNLGSHGPKFKKKYYRSHGSC